MTQQLFLVKGFYKGAADAPVTFTVAATNTRMVRSFVHAYVPGLVMRSVTRTEQQAEQHYCFADVNPVISASFHLGNRRRTGSAIHSRRRTAVAN